MALPKEEYKVVKKKKQNPEETCALDVLGKDFKITF